MAVWVVSNGVGDILKVCNGPEKAFMFVVGQIYIYDGASVAQKMEAIRRLSKRYEKNSANYYVELGERVIDVQQCEVEEE